MRYHILKVNMLYLRKTAFTSICEIRFKWPEMKKFYQMAVLNNAPHSNTQFRVECSVLFFFLLHVDVCQLIYFRVTLRKKLLKKNKRLNTVVYLLMFFNHAITVRVVFQFSIINLRTLAR